MQAEISNLIWIVVKVESGIPVVAEAYEDEEKALSRERMLREEDFNPDDDETGVFPTHVVMGQHASVSSD
jgi:hypothetical protein